MDDATAFSIAKAINENRQFLIDVFPHLKDMNFKEQALKNRNARAEAAPRCQEVLAFGAVRRSVRRAG